MSDLARKLSGLPGRLGTTSRAGVPGVVGFEGTGERLAPQTIAGESQPIVPSLQVAPWWQQPLPSSQFVYGDSLQATGTVQVVPNGGIITVLAGTAFQVPSSFKAVITNVTLLVQSSTPTDNFFFTFRRNQGPIEGLRQLRTFPIAGNGTVRPFNGYVVRLDSGDLFDCTVTNSGPAAVSVSVSYLGWIAAQSEIERFQSSFNY